MQKSILFLAILISGSFQAKAQAPVYEIYALKFSGITAAPVSELAIGAPKKDSMDLFFMYWLVKGNNGRNILLDAGFLPDADKEMRPSFYMRPDSVLMEMNIKADEITDIILSHPHWDHVDGVPLFPNAHVWIQKEDYELFCRSGMAKGRPEWWIS